AGSGAGCCWKTCRCSEAATSAKNRAANDCAMTIAHRRLGRSGLEVSSLCLGAMMFGDRADEAESERIVRQARDAGINFIDTADAYGGGRSEEIVGKTIKGDRDWWIVATKVGTR